MSFRATSLALCSVAIDTVVPGDEHRLEHGERRDGARAPDVDLDLQQRGLGLLGGNLKAIAHRGNFDVVPSGARSAMAVELDDDAVGVERRARASRLRVSRSTRGSTRPPRRCRRALFQCDSTGSPQLFRLRASSACVSGISSRADHLIQERAQSALPDLRRDRSDGWRPMPRCADSRSAARPRLRARCWCARIPSAAGRSRRESRSCRLRPAEQACAECP